MLFTDREKRSEVVFIETSLMWLRSFYHSSSWKGKRFAPEKLTVAGEAIIYVEQLTF